MVDARKTVLITGCSSGIGYHLALAFHEEGFRVFATARKAESLTTLKDKGIETLSLVVDNDESVQSCFKEVQGLLEGCGLDFLINNAGRSYKMPALDAEMSEIRQTFESNLFSVMNINKTFSPLLIAAQGTLVHNGSLTYTMPAIFLSTYNITKAALHAYCNTLRIELAPFGVHVLYLVTGGVKSNIGRVDWKLPAESLYQPFEQQFENLERDFAEGKSDTHEYAKQVVAACLNARGRWWNRNDVWLGRNTSKTWLVSVLDMLWPGGVWSYVMRTVFGIRSLVKTK